MALHDSCVMNGHDQAITRIPPPRPKIIAAGDSLQRLAAMCPQDRELQQVRVVVTTKLVFEPAAIRLNGGTEMRRCWAISLTG